MKYFFTVAFLIFYSNVCKSQNLVITDLENFNEMYFKLPEAKSTNDTLNLIRTLVLDKGTETFKEYFKLKEKQNNYKIENEYLRTLRQYPKYYSSVVKQSKIFKSKKLTKKVNKVYDILIKNYPEAKIKPNYICIGIMDDGGKSFETGQFIGLELFACNKNADISELINNPVTLNYLKGTSFDLMRIDELILHELVHLSQFKGNDKFLQTFKGTIKYIPLLGEGGAAFITDLLFNFKATIGPGTFNTEQFDYCEQNTAKLWQDYKNLKDNSMISDFFYKNTTLYPVRSVGYYLGYKVCKQYYDKATDKKKAIKEIIEVTDYDKLVIESGF
jgi:uncharacterized protein YjaZ